ncbi:MAG: N-acetyltransferase [Zunongwangia sp.]|nr:N-acetyltransferase [Zunongwangia sp.]
MKKIRISLVEESKSPNKSSKNSTPTKTEIGLWLLPEFWGQGIMTEALPLITHYTFKQLYLHQMEGFVETENTNCKKAMAKLDFKKERTLQKAEFKNGKPINLEGFIKMNTNRL